MHIFRSSGLSGNDQTETKTDNCELITNHDVDTFYVGNQGKFNAIVRSTLRELSDEYPQITYAVVLAYIPGKNREYIDYSDAMFPEGIETVPPRYAISWRNNWMLKQSDYIVSYITHTWGGAVQFVRKAIKSEKTVINLGSSMDIG